MQCFFIPFATHKHTLGSIHRVEERVAIASWKLGTNVECRTISHLFSVGLSSACVIVYEVCKAILDALLHTSSYPLQIKHWKLLGDLRTDGTSHSALEL